MPLTRSCYQKIETTSYILRVTRLKVTTSSCWFRSHIVCMDAQTHTHVSMYAHVCTRSVYVFVCVLVTPHVNKCKH